MAWYKKNVMITAQRQVRAANLRHRNYLYASSFTICRISGDFFKTRKVIFIRPRRSRVFYGYK